MRTVVLPAGPRGSGKTTHAELVQKADPDVVIVSRDTIVKELFGNVYLKPNTPQFRQAFQTIQQKVAEALYTPDCKIIFDCWNQSAADRTTICNMLRTFGAKNIICWNFVTPKETCMKWFKEKNDVHGWNEDVYLSHYNTYHRESSGIKHEKFDGFYNVDPREFNFKIFPVPF